MRKEKWCSIVLVLKPGPWKLKTGIDSKHIELVDFWKVLFRKWFLFLYHLTFMSNNLHLFKIYSEEWLCQQLFTLESINLLYHFVSDISTLGKLPLWNKTFTTNNEEKRVILEQEGLSGTSKIYLFPTTIPLSLKQIFL